MRQGADGMWRAIVELATGRAPLPFFRGRTMPGWAGACVARAKPLRRPELGPPSDL